MSGAVWWPVDEGGARELTRPRVAPAPRWTRALPAAALVALGAVVVAGFLAADGRC